ncbi:ABC transporter ATP-binding protein [Marivibrio halodurans]|uniref:ABC transporter ATP-binding protein n=1 Tax=Marivibrio halodurans TaxID=2039722 RepID=A0A8J7SJ64_9PROT|nr:ABC transporter ATP-binding protein [Marivibrio halodurans]MBP5857513.1 ABC transporter ATP-binding protein [Marivibrio halodurans]
MRPLLSIQDLTIVYGGLVALGSVSFDVDERAIHGVIGPNGAGKSTLVNALTGFAPISSGTVTLADRHIGGIPAHAAAAAGIARTFQNIRLFAGMTVLENTLVGAHRHFRARLPHLLLRAATARGEEKRWRERAMGELDFVGLTGQAQASAGALSYGHQRRLEIARALLLEPALLLLDEPMAGMNAAEKEEIETLIRKVRERGVTVLIIEHDMQVMRRLCERVTVLHHGRRLADGATAEVFAETAVQEAYLGRSS